MEKNYTVALVSNIVGSYDGLDKSTRLPLERNIISVSDKRYKEYHTANGIITRNKYKAEVKDLIPYEIFNERYQKYGTAHTEIIRYEAVSVTDPAIKQFLEA